MSWGVQIDLQPIADAVGDFSRKGIGEAGDALLVESERKVLGSSLSLDVGFDSATLFATVDEGANVAASAPVGGRSIPMARPGLKVLTPGSMSMKVTITPSAQAGTRVIQRSADDIVRMIGDDPIVSSIEAYVTELMESAKSEVLYSY